jgi:hypothetical protein
MKNKGKERIPGHLKREEEEMRRLEPNHHK